MEDQEVMQMIPWLIREENNGSDDYEPKVVSLGPYHHGKEKLKFVEDFKPKAVKLFIGDENEEEDFINAILRDIEYARSCYLEEFTGKYSDEVFARMLLHDSCVILNYMGPTEVEASWKKAWTIKHLGPVAYTSIRRDMYLLENQVPFKILMILVDLKYGFGGGRFIKMMETTCFEMFFGHLAYMEKPNDTNRLGTEPLHLLEIFRRVAVTGHDHESWPRAYPCCSFNNLVSCIEKCCGCRSKERTKTNTPGRYVFRSVTTMKSKGIHFTASKINSFKGVRLSPPEFCKPAKLKLPSWNITMHTRVFFKNMIAYELLSYPHISSYVTAYVSLMKLLVVKEEDAKELCEKEIIINNLGNDEQVVQLYNALNTYELIDTAFYWDVKRDIEEHYNSKLKLWMDDLKTKYFDSPWSIIALAGTVLLLFLTILQTYYSAPRNEKGKSH